MFVRKIRNTVWAENALMESLTKTLPKFVTQESENCV